MTRQILGVLGALLLLSSPMEVLGQPAERVSAIHAQLDRWAAERPKEVQRIEYGRSAGGRPLLALRIAGVGPVDPDARPAVFVGANIAGFHTLGSGAALHLIEALLAGAMTPKLTYYVVPVMNPDAHEATLGPVRRKRSGNDQPVDRDRDGQVGEDGVDDLDGDDRITWLRIAEPTGEYLPDELEPRLLVKADPLRGQRGRYRLESEGRDDDGDGDYNEDGDAGVHPDQNFAHGFVYASPDAGPWGSSAPEARAIMEFLLARRNVALAVVYGPANMLLELPKGFDGQAPFGDAQPLEIPKHLASRLGLTPGKPATLAQAWRAAKTLPFARARSLTKDRLAQMLVRKPAASPAESDVQILRELAKGYTERLKGAGQGGRPGRTQQRGGLTPWLYFHYGVMAIELDVWGVPKAESPAPSPAKDGEQSEEEAAAAKAKEKAEAEAKGSPELQRRREVLRYCAEKRPGAFAPWKAVTLPDGTLAEAGGLDPLAEFTPPADQRPAALAVHTETVLDLASRLARVELLQVNVTPLGGGVSRLDVVAGNTGYLPTHTGMGVLARSHTPIRLELELGEGVTLVTGQRWRSTERLAGTNGTLRAEWLVRGPAGASVDVVLGSQNAGSARRRVELKGAQ